MRKTDIGIIGMGAAGSMAGIAASEIGARVALFDGNEKLGKKIYITGKGRCNVTNATAFPAFMDAIVRHPRFLYSAFTHWDNADTMDFFAAHGVPLKVERGERVFPVSDKASDINRALERALRENGAQLYMAHRVTQIVQTPSGFRLFFDHQEPFDVKKLIIATGGCSYPATGSTGEGYRFAQSWGHRVTPLFPSLVPLECEEDVSAWEGISLRNVALTLSGEREFGELVFTRQGISGPIVLTLSAKLAGEDLTGAPLVLDWKPALDEETLKRRLQRERENAPNRSLSNLLKTLLPQRVVSLFMAYGGLPEDAVVNSLRREMQQKIVQQLKHFTLTFRNWGTFHQSVVTRGGIELKEVNPKDLSSKLVSDLYFAGEILDVDAKTGGYNLQIAFSTGHLAGASAAATLNAEEEEK